MSVEAATVQFPQREGAPDAAVDVAERVDGLEAIVEDCRADRGREVLRRPVPPVQELAHELGDIGRTWREVVTDTDLDGAVFPLVALVHDALAEDAVEHADLVLMDRVLVDVPLQVAEPGEVVDHLAPRARYGLRALGLVREGAYLREGERVALDGRRRVGVRVRASF